MKIVLMVGVSMLLFVPAITHAATATTTVITTAAQTIATQSAYRWFSNTDALNPISALAAENTATETPSQGTTVRLRMAVSISSLNLGAGATFALQYANSTSGSFTTMTSSTAWSFTDNASVADGQTIATTMLTGNDVGATYNESNPTAGTPSTITAGQEGEWDWVVLNSSAAATSNWFFRMIYSSGTVFDTYSRYPALNAQSSQSTSTGGGGGGTPIGIPPAYGGAPPKIPPLSAPDAPSILAIADLNGDHRIDMRDFSILLYYYGKIGGGTPSDFNRDNNVDLADVSILLYYWTV